LCAVGTVEAERAVTCVSARNRVGVAPRAGVARVAGAVIVQMAQQSNLARWTLAIEPADPIVTGAAIQTISLLTVILVGLAVGADVAVDADALVTALSVLTSAVVLARLIILALVDILTTVATLPVVWAATTVRVDAVHAGGSMLAQVAQTIVNVLFAIVALESCCTVAGVVEVANRGAHTTVLAGRRVARDVRSFTVLPSVSFIAVAFVASISVDTLSVDARITAQADITLVHVIIAVGALEARHTSAPIAIAEGGARRSVAAGLPRTIVWLATCLSFPS